MRSILKRMFIRKNNNEELEINTLQVDILENIKENIDKLSDLEKIEIKSYLENSLKEYEIARLEKKLMYADDIEYYKIKKELNYLLGRDNLEDYEH